jgi:hypothetical protein
VLVPFAGYGTINLNHCHCRHCFFLFQSDLCFVPDSVAQVNCGWQSFSSIGVCEVKGTTATTVIGVPLDVLLTSPSKLPNAIALYHFKCHSIIKAPVPSAVAVLYNIESCNQPGITSVLLQIVRTWLLNY